MRCLPIRCILEHSQPYQPQQGPPVPEHKEQIREFSSDKVELDHGVYGRVVGDFGATAGVAFSQTGRGRAITVFPIWCCVDSGALFLIGDSSEKESSSFVLGSFKKNKKGKRMRKKPKHLRKGEIVG